MKFFPAAALPVLLIPVSLAAALPRQWEFAVHSYLTRTQVDPGAPANAHPAQLDPAALKAALGALTFVAEGKEAPLFHPDELDRLANAMARDLALTQPREDLGLVSNYKREKGWLSDGLSVVGKVFIRDGKLNVIVHDPRMEWVVAYNLTDRLPDFDFGSRARPGDVVLKAAGATFPRPDWAVFELGALASAGQPAPAPKAAAQPVAAPAPKPAAQPVATPQSSPTPTQASIEERLRGLKRFRDQNLITEEEYSRQKQDLLKAYAQGN